MSTVVPKSCMNWSWRAVLPALMGSTADAGALQPVVQAEAAGEHAVAEGDLGDVAACDAGGDGEPADELRPGVEVALACSRRRPALPVVPDEEWISTTSLIGTANRP